MTSETTQDKNEEGEYDQQTLEVCLSTLYSIYGNKDR